MRITAALAWWDESPADLEACIRGIATVADRVVAYDGAYARFPGGTPSSPPEQAEVIRRIAAECGLDCVVFAPDRLWAGQLEKRTALYRAAAEGSDWIVVVDADHIVHADRKAVRAEVAALPPEVGCIVATYSVPLNPDGGGYASKWHVDGAGRTDDHRLFFRSFPGLQVEGRHWWVSADGPQGRFWVLHTDATGFGLPGYRLTARYEVEHRYLFRDEARVEASRLFLADRAQIVEETDQEDDLS